MDNSLHENLYNVVNSIIFCSKEVRASVVLDSVFTHVACIYATLLEQKKTTA